MNLVTDGRKSTLPLFSFNQPDRSRLLKGFAVITQEYRLNRPRFPQTQLAAYQGQWVAFSSDGRRIVGCGSTVGQLEAELAKAGEDAQQVVFEWVAGPEEDSLAPGGDLV